VVEWTGGCSETERERERERGTREPNQQDRRAESGRPKRDVVWEQWGRMMVQTCVVTTIYLARSESESGQGLARPGGLARWAEKEREASWAPGWAALGWWLLAACCWADGCVMQDEQVPRQATTTTTPTRPSRRGERRGEARRGGRGREQTGQEQSAGGAGGRHRVLTQCRGRMELECRGRTGSGQGAGVGDTQTRGRGQRASDQASLLARFGERVWGAGWHR
jgi:hypothetical protein